MDIMVHVEADKPQTLLNFAGTYARGNCDHMQAPLFVMRGSYPLRFLYHGGGGRWHLSSCDPRLGLAAARGAPHRPPASRQTAAAGEAAPPPPSRAKLPFDLRWEVAVLTDCTWAASTALAVGPAPRRCGDRAVTIRVPPALGTAEPPQLRRFAPAGAWHMGFPVLLSTGGPSSAPEAKGGDDGGVAHDSDNYLGGGGGGDSGGVINPGDNDARRGPALWLFRSARDGRWAVSGERMPEGFEPLALARSAAVGLAEPPCQGAEGGEDGRQRGAGWVAVPGAQHGGSFPPSLRLKARKAIKATGNGGGSVASAASSPTAGGKGGGEGMASGEGKNGDGDDDAADDDRPRALDYAGDYAAVPGVAVHGGPLYATAPGSAVAFPLESAPTEGAEGVGRMAGQRRFLYRHASLGCWLAADSEAEVAAGVGWLRGRPRGGGGGGGGSGGSGGSTTRGSAAKAKGGAGGGSGGGGAAPSDPACIDDVLRLGWHEWRGATGRCAGGG